MFRIFCGNGAGPLGAGEHAAVQRLFESRAQLVMSGRVADVKSEAGYTACAAFLSNIDSTAQALGLDAAPRGYRTNFSANYRALFPDGNRHYRVDVLEASVDQQFDIWVNGERFELSSEAMVQAQTLQRAWVDLVAILDRWPSADRRPNRGDFSSALVAFDAAWSTFEHRYIGELIAIEEKARKLVIRAVQMEGLLPDPDTLTVDSPQVVEAEKSFIQCIAHLNSIANYKRKGRDDLSVGILESARAVMRQCNEKGGCASRGQEAARVLAGDIIASYAAMRNYIRKVGTCIEHVDPHLCNNVGLVARLVDYEETWEIGARYVQQTPLLDAVCDVVAEIRVVEQLAPELSAMIEDCDVELFMVLPRLVVLSFLADPRGKRAELVRSLLPHRFGPADPANPGAAFLKVDPELKGLYSRFKETVQLLGANLAAASPVAAPPSPSSTRRAIWEGMVRQAVLGDSAEDGPAAGDAQKAARDLLRTVETWSLELQRHCPEDWNQCSAVLVHCLTGGGEKTPPAKFVV